MRSPIQAGRWNITTKNPAYSNLVWLNPTPEKYWPYSASTDLIRRLMADRMYPLTLHGLDQAMRELTR
jgi:uncharacterized protein with von Willebrand factor type A (vWA) domain